MEIDMKLKSYAGHYSFQDKQDMMAMTLLHFSAMAVTLENSNHGPDPSVVNKLKELDRMLSELLV